MYVQSAVGVMSELRPEPHEPEPKPKQEPLAPKKYDIRNFFKSSVEEPKPIAEPCLKSDPERFLKTDQKLEDFDLRTKLSLSPFRAFARKERLCCFLTDGKNKQTLPSKNDFPSKIVPKMSEEAIKRHEYTYTFTKTTESEEKVNVEDFLRKDIPTKSISKAENHANERCEGLRQASQDADDNFMKNIERLHKETSELQPSKNLIDALEALYTTDTRSLSNESKDTIVKILESLTVLWKTPKLLDEETNYRLKLCDAMRNYRFFVRQEFYKSKN